MTAGRHLQSPGRLAVLLSVLLTLLPLQVHAANSASYSQQVAFRMSFGLPADAGTILRAEADPSADWSYGVALLSPEAAMLHSRDRRILSLQPQLEALAKLPEYGGAYVDENGVAVVGLTHLGAAAQIPLPADGSIRLRVVSNSLSRLEALRQRLRQDYVHWIDEGVELSSWSVDPAHNVLRIEVIGLTPETKSRLEAAYGPNVEVLGGEVVRFVACLSRDSCPSPLKGGLRIWSPVRGCSSGFLGRPTAAYTKLYVLTAGHCISSIGENWTHDRVVIGQSEFTAFQNQTWADLGGIRATESGAKNQYFASSTADIRNVTGPLANLLQMAGSTICRSGATSGWRCGKISKAASDEVIQGVLIKQMWVADFPSAGGDSGAPMTNNGTLAGGILSASSTVASYYSTIDIISDHIGVRPCYTPACG